MTLVDRALALNPNSAHAWGVKRLIATWRGDPDMAINALERAIRRSPLDAQNCLWSGYRPQAVAAGAVEREISVVCELRILIPSNDFAGQSPISVNSVRDILLCDAMLGRDLFHRLTIAKGLSRCPREPHMMYSGLAASHTRQARGGAQWQGHDL
jgi:hypothetical protein